MGYQGRSGFVRNRADEDSVSALSLPLVLLSPPCISSLSHLICPQCFLAAPGQDLWSLWHCGWLQWPVGRFVSQLWVKERRTSELLCRVASCFYKIISSIYLLLQWDKLLTLLLHRLKQPPQDPKSEVGRMEGLSINQVCSENQVKAGSE